MTTVLQKANLKLGGQTSVSRGCEAGVRTQAAVTQNLHVTRTLCCHPKEPRLELKSHRSSKMQWMLRCEQGRLSPPCVALPCRLDF